MLAWTIYLSFAGALLQALLPRSRPNLARWLALAVAVAGLVTGMVGFAAAMGQGRTILVDVPWIPSLGIHFLLAADGISRVLVLLTGSDRGGVALRLVGAVEPFPRRAVGKRRL